MREAGVLLFPHQLDGIGRMLHLLSTLGYAILGDGMGIGKQYQTIGLIVELRKLKRCKPCLIVLPTNLLKSWRDDFLTKVQPQLIVIEYHGRGRHSVTKGQVLAADVVITTYELVGQEYEEMCNLHEDLPLVADGHMWKSRFVKPSSARELVPLAKEWPRCLLFTIAWNLVALEEGHNIKKRSSQRTKGCIALSADCRLIITGTPYMNEYRDIWAYFAFLRVEPLDNEAVYSQYFILKGRADILKRRLEGKRCAVLHVILRGISIRRESGDIFAGRQVDGAITPLKTVLHTHALDNGEVFGAVTRSQFLDKPCTEAQTQDATKYDWNPEYRLIADGCRDAKPPRDLPHDHPKKNTLREQMIARMSVCHWALQFARYARSSTPIMPSAHTTSSIDISVDPFMELAEIEGSLDTWMDMWMAKEEDMDSSVMQEDDYGMAGNTDMTTRSDDLLRLMAGHRDVVKNGKKKSEREVFIHAMREGDMWKSSRMLAVATSIHDHLRTHAGKVLVFSEFLAALDVLAIGLKKEYDYDCLAYNGTLSTMAKDDGVRQFQQRDGPRIMLVTMRAGGVGLNLTAADGVFILNLTWTPAYQDQAIKRAHRIGQLRDVSAHIFTANESIEDWMERTGNEKTIQGNEIVMQATRDAKITATVNQMKCWSYEQFVSEVSRAMGIRHR